MMFKLITDALRRTAYSLIAFLAFLVLMPNLPPYDVDFKGLSEPRDIPFTGGLTANHRLETAEPLSRGIKGHSSLGYIKGAESFALKGNFLYTGVQGGDILRLNVDQPRKPWEFVAKIGQVCSETHQEEKCGRVLGLKFDKEGQLIAADAYFGLYRVNVETGKATPLVPASLEIDGRRNLLTNSVAISQDGKTIYYSVSSTHFVLHNGIYELITAPSGRVLKYDVYGNMSKVIMDEISFANGIALSPNEDFLLVAETGASTVWRYWLKGDKRGQKEVFAHTPGGPDNIQPSEDGSYLIGIPVVKMDGESSLAGRFFTNPVLAKVAVRLCCLVQLILEAFINNVAYFEPAAIMIHRLGNTEHSGANILPPYGLIIELNSQGEIVQSWHSTDPLMSKLSEGFLHNGQIYLGSPYNKFVSKVPYYR